MINFGKKSVQLVVDVPQKVAPVAMQCHDVFAQAEKEFNLIRGEFITNYCEYEEMLVQILLICKLFPEYKAQFAVFPRTTFERIKGVLTLSRANGPLKQELGCIRAAVESLIQYNDFRNYLAHGHLEISQSKDHSFKYSLEYISVAEGEARRKTFNTSLNELSTFFAHFITTKQNFASKAKPILKKYSERIPYVK